MENIEYGWIISFLKIKTLTLKTKDLLPQHVGSANQVFENHVFSNDKTNVPTTRKRIGLTVLYNVCRMIFAFCRSFDNFERSCWRSIETGEFGISWRSVEILKEAFIDLFADQTLMHSAQSISFLAVVQAVAPDAAIKMITDDPPFLQETLALMTSILPELRKASVLKRF